MKRAVTTTIAALASALAIAACGQQETGTQQQASEDGGTPVVGLVMKSLGNPYFQQMQQGAEEHAEELGDIELRTAGTQSETDVSGQVEAVNNMVAQGVDAIVIAPADSQALVAPLAQADAAGIDVVNIDVKLDDTALEQAGLDIPFVGPDNVAGAKQVGDVLAEQIGPGGRVVILEGVPSAANATQRKEGFLQAAQAGDLEVVTSRTANWETAEANTVFTNILSANPDIDGVMAANDAMALGVISALEAAGRADDIAVVGFDNIPEVQPALQEGTLLATLDQYGSQQAAYGIDTALELLDGAEAAEWEKTPVDLVAES